MVDETKNEKALYLPHKKKLKVLIVDDNKLDQMILREILNKLGLFDIHIADDASKARMMIWNTIEMRSPYHYVFLDWRMPKIDGLTLYKEFKNDPQLERTSFILTTGEGDEIEVKKALNAGIKDYMLKPIKLDVVYRKLSQLDKLI